MYYMLDEVDFREITIKERIPWKSSIAQTYIQPIFKILIFECEINDDKPPLVNGGLRPVTNKLSYSPNSKVGNIANIKGNHFLMIDQIRCSTYKICA